MSDAKQRKILDPRIDMDRLPRHIAVIMDGNGRWAEQHGKRHVEGHEAGARSVREIIEGCRELGIEVLTLYAFSTENWKRSKIEVEALFRLMSKYIYREIEEIDKNGIRVGHLGRFAGLPANAQIDNMPIIPSINVPINQPQGMSGMATEMLDDGELPSRDELRMLGLSEEEIDLIYENLEAPDPLDSYQAGQEALREPTPVQGDGGVGSSGTTTSWRTRARSIAVHTSSFTARYMLFTGPYSACWMRPRCGR